MRLPLALVLALPLAIVPVAHAQDFFQPLEDAIDSFTRPPVRSGPPIPVPAEADTDEAGEVTPPRPQPRPEVDEEAADPEPAAVPVPRPRPDEEPEEPAAEEAEEPPAPVAVEKEPEEERVYQVACPAVLNGLVEAEALPPLSEGACGEHSPLSVTGVMSRGHMVPLSSPLTTNCEMATALPAWVSAVDAYALATENAGVEALTTGTSYSCRNRNNADEGPTSEHGFANAADIVGFTLDNGETITVKSDWLPATAPKGRFLRFAHDAACTGFTTVLGPEANALHEDHFHLDLGCHGRSCTARLCE